MEIAVTILVVVVAPREGFKEGVRAAAWQAAAKPAAAAEEGDPAGLEIGNSRI